MKLPRLAVALLTATLMAGCASTSELNEVRSLAQQAMDAAGQASQDANAAMNAAGNAQACCQSNRARINRAFEDSMRK
ncbi:MAG: alanine-zipper protein [Marinobacterium sp.]|nr:alanine-zipper protein [Marinobacterium sp.]